MSEEQKIAYDKACDDNYKQSMNYKITNKQLFWQAFWGFIMTCIVSYLIFHFR